MNSKPGVFAIAMMALVPVLSSCGPPPGWGTDVTATSLNGDQWQVDVVIMKLPNREHAQDLLISSPSLICRSGESAEMRIGNPTHDDDSITVKIDTAENPSTDEMVFKVEVRDGGLLRSRTFLKVQPDEDATATSAQAGDTSSK